MEERITELKSEKIYLREFKETDWRDVHKYASNPIVCRYQIWGPNTESDSQEFVNQVIKEASHNPRTRYVFAIIHKKTKQLIGAGELNVTDLTNRQGEIGYSLNPDYWGQGLATETTQLLVRLGFDQLKLHRIYATCDPRNVGSFKVMEKIGMKIEGRMRETLLLRDGWRDSYLYSILEEDWAKLDSKV